MKAMKILSFGTMALLIVLLIAATIVERIYGTAMAQTLIYTSPVTIVLWAIMAYSGLVYIFRNRMHKRPATLLLHLSFIVILSGAFVTHILGEHGTLHLRQGLPARHYMMDDGRMRMLPYALTLHDFHIEYYPDGELPRDYVSIVESSDTEGDAAVISMNHIYRSEGYRFCQADYDADEQGTVLSVNHDPWGIGITYTGYGLLLLAFLTFFLQRGSRFRSLLRSPLLRERKLGLPMTLLGIIIAAFALLILFSYQGDDGLAPVLHTPILGVHVSIIILSYALLAFLMINGIMGLCSKSKAAHLQVISNILLYPAVFLLAIGIFIGAVWGNISWGRYWAWDPKETWALITMLICAAGFHVQSLPWLRNPRHYHLFTVLAFLCVLVTYFGVNLIFGGMHSYGNL